MCTAAFSLYNCRRLGPGDLNRTLVADAAVPCAGAAFSLHRAAAAATVAFVTLVPLWFLRGMTRGPDDWEQERAAIQGARLRLLIERRALASTMATASPSPSSGALSSLMELSLGGGGAPSSSPSRPSSASGSASGPTGVM